MYKNVILTQNVVNFLRHILPYLSFLMKDIITKKDSSSSLMSFASQSFIGKDVDITFLYILAFKAKCCKLLTGSVFVVRFVNDVVELELSFL